MGRYATNSNECLLDPPRGEVTLYAQWIDPSDTGGGETGGSTSPKPGAGNGLVSTGAEVPAIAIYAALALLLAGAAGLVFARRAQRK